MAEGFSRIPEDSDWELEIDRYQTRVIDIEIYLKHLDEMEQKAYLHPVQDSSRLLSIMKNNIHLMMYNLVESTIMGCLKILEKRLGELDYPFSQLRTSLFHYWMHKHSNEKDKLLFKMLSSRKSLRELFADEKVFESFSIYSDGGGNWDNNQIKTVLTTLEIILPRAPWKIWEKHRLNGTAFQQIKAKRNNLAHGDYAFSENVETITIQDLREKFQFIKLYLRKIICIIIDYIYNEKFLKSNSLYA